MIARLDETFARLRRDRHTGLVAFVTAGDPDLPRSADVIRAVDAGGADVIEIGVPFSDPVADGPEIQRASERALAAGTTLGRVLTLVAEIRPSITASIVLFTYANPVVRMGLDTFARRSAEAGADGVLLVDLPLEEAAEAQASLVAHDLAPIFLVSPTTSDDRMRRSGELGRGFLYAISRLGVTGARSDVAGDARTLVGRIRAQSTLPVALGFGLSRPEHVREVGQYADAAVVGSALVARVKQHGADDDLAGRIESFVAWLRGGAS